MEEHTWQQVREGNGEKQSLLLGDAVAEKKELKKKMRMMIFHPHCFSEVTGVSNLGLAEIPAAVWVCPEWEPLYGMSQTVHLVQMIMDFDTW